MRPPRFALVPVTALLLLGLTACAGAGAAPTPTRTSTASPRPTPDSSGSATPVPDAEVSAATVVVTSSGIAVFGTDGSTLASETYRTDAATVAAHLAEALDEEAVVSDTGPIGESCDSITVYRFGGLQLNSPGGLGSAGSVGSADLYEAYVTDATTGGGVAIETVAGQHIGSTREAFEAAVGDEMLLDAHEGASAFGFDIVNPEAGPYDLIGVQAWFDDDRMTAWSAPAAIGFVGDCG